MPLPKMVPGKISFRWAKTRDDGSDWFGVYMQPADRGTNRFVIEKLSEIAEELVRRGYERRSIRFECALSAEEAIKRSETPPQSPTGAA